MNIAKLSIKRPILISSIVLVIMVVGMLSFKSIGLEYLPDLNLPAINVATRYSGASPDEIEKLISKPLEDQLGSLQDLKYINSQNDEGLSIITLEFSNGVDIDKKAQDVRDKISVAKNNLPVDLESDPIVQKFDPSATAVIRLALVSNLSMAQIYDLANEKIKPQLEKINGVGNVDILGGTKREIQIEIDQTRLNQYKLSLTDISNSFRNAGKNVPIGKKEHGSTQTIFRAMGEFNHLSQIENTSVSFSGDVGNSVSVKTLGSVKDLTKDIESIAYIYYPAHSDLMKNENASGQEKTKIQSCVYLDVIKQSGKNTVKVTDGVKEQLPLINNYLKSAGGGSHIIITIDQSKWIRMNVEETLTTIILGIILAVLVVYLFLGNIRATIITAISIPNSLLGAIIIMNVFGYTFNVMTLMAISLVVGLLVDDAIVVQENIFRKLEQGLPIRRAAEFGTKEVLLAVVATTLVIVCVFFPVGTINSLIGQVLKQFSFTIVFAMLVSLFDALAVAPFLNAYFAAEVKKPSNFIIRGFDKFQERLEFYYGKIMKYALKHPLIIILITLVVFFSSVVLLAFVKQTFAPEGDRGEFAINIEMPAGTSLEGTNETLRKIAGKLSLNEDVNLLAVTVGNTNGEATKGSIQCFLKARRKKDTDENKKFARNILAEFPSARSSVNQIGADPSQSPFQMIVSGNDLTVVQKASTMIVDKLKGVKGLLDIDSTMKKGSPELRINFDQEKMLALGVLNKTAGYEIRYSINGVVVGTFRENGIDYDIRLRLKPEQRDLAKTYENTLVPNMKNIMIPVSSIATKETAAGISQINKRNKTYIVKIRAEIDSSAGLGNLMKEAKIKLGNHFQLPEGVSFSFTGESENLSDMSSDIGFALLMAVLLIYFVLASLYESFVTPFTILLAIPPALTGALLALVIFGFTLDIASMIGIVMLLGIVAKNSILLVDHAVHGVNSGLERKEAILQAGIRRLRPILMTSFAMIAGTIPLALGIGEAAQLRQSMGVAIIGGLIISTLVTLIVVPAVFEFIDRFRAATEAKIIVRKKEEEEEVGEVKN